MTRRWSFRTRFVAAAALCLVPLVGVVLFLLDQSLQHSQDQLFETEFTIADVVSQGLTATLDENQRALADLSDDPAVQAMQTPGAQEPLDQLRRARPSLSGVFLLDPSKHSIAITGGIDPGSLLPQFTDAVDKVLNSGEPAISNRMFVPDGDVDVIALIVPVLPDPGSASAGQPVGVLGAFLNVARLQQTFLTASTSAETTIAVVSSNGQIIVDRGNPEITEKTLTTDLLLGPVQQAVTGQRGREIYTDGNGDERIAVFTPVGHPSVSWATVVTSPSPITYGPNRSALEGGLLALAGAVVLTLALAVLFGELTARPLRQLTTRATAITQGDMSQPMTQVGRGEVAALSNAFHDMADRLTTQVRDTEAAREEVAFQAERLRDLLRRTVRLQEDERRRIASDIHDAVSPLITGALYQARALKLAGNGNGNGHGNGHDGNGDGHQDPNDEGLGTVNELLERAMAELHDVIFALRPPDLDDLGVVAAIERYVQQVNRSGLPCNLEVIGEAVRLSPEARLGLYRIVQEALHNALRHAHADEAVVKMEWLDDRLRVTIRDNGSGFDPDQAANPTSLGLLSMRERAAAIGGTLEILSKPGTGTLVIVDRPLAGDLGAETIQVDADADGATASSDGVERDDESESPAEMYEVRSE
jgi:signal transduction histidine kinase